MATFDPIDLPLWQSGSLARYETKFLATRQGALELLSELARTWRVAEMQGSRRFAYRNVYFDTDRYSLFYAHHRGERPRHKVRLRTYVDTDTRFLEIKTKTARLRCEKARVPVDLDSDPEDLAQELALERGLELGGDRLRPVLSSEYQRVSMIHPEEPLRLTFDFDLSYDAPLARRALPASRAVIVEAKTTSPGFIAALAPAERRRQVRRTSFSKYCIGCCKVVPDLGCNRFRPVLRLLRETERREAAHDA